MIRPPCHKTVIDILLHTIVPPYTSSVLKHPPFSVTPISRFPTPSSSTRQPHSGLITRHTIIDRSSLGLQAVPKR